MYVKELKKRMMYYFPYRSHVIYFHIIYLLAGSQARQTELQDVQVSVIGLGDCHTTFQRSVSTLVVDRRQLCGLGGAKACVVSTLIF